MEQLSDDYHHNRLYKICITTTGKIGTCNRQHRKSTALSGEDYLQDQLCKQTESDWLDNILVQIEKQPYASNIINNTNNEKKTVATQNIVIQEDMMHMTITKNVGRK